MGDGVTPSRLSFSFKAQPLLILFHDTSDSVSSHKCSYVLAKLHIFQKYMYMLVSISPRPWMQQPVYQVKSRKCLVNAALLNIFSFPFLFTRQPRVFSEIIYDKEFQVRYLDMGQWFPLLPPPGTEVGFLGTLGTRP